MTPELPAALESLASPWAYVAVGVFALLESAAFVGLFVPGETAMIIAGFLAAQGRASLALLAAAAAAGAIAGDSAGYTLGRLGAAPLRRSRLGRRVGDDRFRAAEEYLRRRGGIAVFTGRFIGVLRALVPFFAGAGRMPYDRFLLWNIAGAVVWVPLCLLIGFLAGESYQAVEEQVGRLGLIVAGAAVGAAATFLVWRRVRRTPAVG
jgi:membrane protein DedA with SNARE-associated domain